MSAPSSSTADHRRFGTIWDTLKYALVALVAMLLLDTIWLTLNSKAYNAGIVAVQKSGLKVDYVGVGVVYVFMVALVMTARRDPKLAAWLGLLTYAIYNSTSVAIYKHFDKKMAVVDSMWGGVLMSSTVYIANYFSRSKK